MDFARRVLVSLSLSGTVMIAGCRTPGEITPESNTETAAPTSSLGAVGVDGVGIGEIGFEGVAGMSAADLELVFVEEHRDSGSDLIIGGRNATETIAALGAINGISIADLEAQMRPGAGGLEGSTSGFLGPDESLIDVLCADNAYVVDELGLTHQQLARPLLLLAAYAPHSDGEFTYRGIRFEVAMRAFKGSQHSPFHDGTKTNLDFTIRNLDDDLSLSFSLLVPMMVERYGFYEGKGTPYRVEPSAIVELLRLR